MATPLEQSMVFSILTRRCRVERNWKSLTQPQSPLASASAEPCPEGSREEKAAHRLVKHQPWFHKAQLGNRESAYLPKTTSFHHKASRVLQSFSVESDAWSAMSSVTLHRLVLFVEMVSHGALGTKKQERLGGNTKRTETAC
jgi:hypothetical protein